MLMKLTPGVNFTNVLQAAFEPRSQRAKNTAKLSVFVVQNFEIFASKSCF